MVRYYGASAVIGVSGMAKPYYILHQKTAAAIWNDLPCRATAYAITMTPKYIAFNNDTGQVGYS